MRSPPTIRPRLLGVSALLVASLLATAACSGDDGAPAASAPVGADAEEHKVTVAGDSISVGLGAELRDEVRAPAVVKVIGVEGTGLARPDTFDWPARLRELARDFPPEVLVLSLGSNDFQDLTDADGEVVVPMADEDGWDEEYRQRLADAFDAFAGTDTRVVWVGHLRTADDDVADTNRRVHELAVEVAADRPWVEVQDLAELLGTGELTATACLLEDGLHLTVDCLDRAAAGLAPALVPAEAVAP